MKMCKTIPIFILFFTGYFRNADVTTAMGTVTSFSPLPSTTRGLSPPLEDHTQASTEHSSSGPTPSNSPRSPERRLSSALVAGISISLVLLFIIIVAGFWCARKKSKERSAEIHSVPYVEPGVFLRNISMNENQP